MQKDKSRIKDVWRSDALRESLVWVERDAAAPFAASVRVCFEDASVRFSQGGLTGSSLYDSFVASINWHFDAFPSAHTFIMTFDDKRHVPRRKSVTQVSRREALEKSCVRRQLVTWHWDGASPIVTLSDDALPPWERLRLSAGAYARAVDDVATLLVTHYRPPPNRRLVVDEGRRIRVLETTPKGRVMQPYSMPDGWRPLIGEADMSAQWYAAAARSGALHFNARPADHWHERRRPADAVAADALRQQWETGAIVLATTDTDFVTLSLGWMANVVVPEHNIYVSIGRLHLNDANRIVTGNAVGGRPLREYVDVRRMWRTVSRLHASADEFCVVSAWAFVAFSTACGNDYTRRMPGFSHLSMFKGYVAWLRNRRNAAMLIERRVVGGNKPLYLLDADAFQSMLVRCYFERMHEKRRPPKLLEWPLMNEFVRQAEREQRHMPNTEQLKRYFEEVSWSLAYAAAAPHGVEHVPS